MKLFLYLQKYKNLIMIQKNIKRIMALIVLYIQIMMKIVIPH